MRYTEVACAVIVSEGRILATRRGPEMDHAGMWEFPGGKIYPNESAEACVIREIKEELSVTIRVLGTLMHSDFDYPNKKIRLIPFWAEVTEGTIVAAEHDRVEWFQPSQLLRLAWPPADIPIVEQVLQEFVSR